MKLLYLGPILFDAIKQRPQWMALELAKRHTVLYVEPHRSLISHRATTTLASLDGLSVLKTGSRLPLSGCSAQLNRLNYGQTYRDILRWAPEMAEPDVVVCTFPKQVGLLRHLGCAKVIYDVIDDFPLLFDGFKDRNISAYHRALIRWAHGVTTSSELLADATQQRLDRMSPSQQKAAPMKVIHNAVDQDFLTHFRNEPRAAQPVVVGYVGAVADWFDWEAVMHLAQQCPDWMIEIVGPIDTALPSALPANIRLLGEKPHHVLPTLMKRWSLGLIPFRQSSFVDAVNPVKVYEYLGAYLPVLSTDFSSILPFRPLVTVASPKTWANAARQLVTEDNHTAREARRAYAEQHTWTQRTSAFEALLSEIISSKAAKGE